jgi:hypothetical protein
MEAHMRNLGTLFGITLIAAAVVVTAWSVEPTVGKTPTVSLDPLSMTGTVTNLLPEVHYDHGFIFPEEQ